jgi:hypothetical protein
LTKPQVAPVKKLILEADKMLNLKKKSGNISTTEQERSEGNNLNMGISPRSKPLFSRKGKHETTGVKIKKLKMLFEGASPLKVRPNGIDFKLRASLGTDLSRTTGLDGLGKKQEIRPIGKISTEMTSPSRKIIE